MENMSFGPGCRCTYSIFPSRNTLAYSKESSLLTPADHIADGPIAGENPFGIWMAGTCDVQMLTNILAIFYRCEKEDHRREKGRRLRHLWRPRRNIQHVQLRGSQKRLRSHLRPGGVQHQAKPGADQRSAGRESQPQEAGDSLAVRDQSRSQILGAGPLWLHDFVRIILLGIYRD